jgi:dTDP-4-amino-4,6-dideoxygalactose transaminase
VPISQVPLLDINAQNGPLKEEILGTIEKVFDSGKFIMGPWVDRFEKEISEYIGADHSTGVSSGTDALLLSLMAIGVGPGDAVITTTFSFFASAGVVARVGAVPFFADIEYDSFNISPESAELAVLKAKDQGYNVKAIVPVHLFGQCADMASILDIAQKYNLKVIEDAAQALGAMYPLNGNAVGAGTLGDCGCFSFFPSKNLGCLGDGGLITARDDTLADRIRLLRTHGARPKYYHAEIGGNFRLDAIQAAVLSVKLRHLDKWHEGRKKNAGTYRRLFSDSGLVDSGNVVLPVEKCPGVEKGHIYNQFVIRVKERDRLKKYLDEKKVG